MQDLKVLYEDNHIIAVVKPAGMLTQGDKSGDVSLYDLVKDYIREKKGKPTLHKHGNALPLEARERSGVFLGLVHRLDKPVQGIVLFGKTSKGASRLSEQFRNHTIQKTYHGIVAGKPKEEKGVIKEQVNKISFFAEGFTSKTDEELLQEIKKATKTRTAELSWEVVRAGKPFDTAQGKSVYTLLKILPKTGRFHQIRIQFANMGHPILGDVKYADNSIVRQYFGEWKSRNAIALCATAISFKSATLPHGSVQAEDKTINLEIPLPEEWKKYI